VRLIIASLALAAASLSVDAVAAPGAASVMPSALSASLQSTLPTTLVWTVSIAPIVTAKVAPTITLTSPQALVTAPDGHVLQIDPVALTLRVPAGGQSSATESFTLSPATIAAALQSGANRLLLTRTFAAAQFTFTATAVITLGGSASGPLTLSRVSLHFEDRQLVRMLEAGESAVAIAEIDFSGGGTLNGLWEVAGPPSTQGQAVFTPLASASVNLEGGGLTEITSPPLPSARVGLYYVRFRVRSPAVPFEGLVLQYAVAGEELGAPPITVIRPEQHATLSADTRFEWQPAPGAVAYRLEFYDADAAAMGGRPLSGEWVPAAQRDALLSVLAQTHLQSGQLYRWRIVALSDRAQVVGRSAFYEIRTP
jgi:hypothetical protein